MTNIDVCLTIKTKPKAIPKMLKLQRRNTFPAVLLSLAFVSAGSLAAADNHTLRVGVYSNPPKIFLDSEGKASGIFPDLLDAIAQKEDLSFIYVPCEWQQCLEMVQSGQLDIMPDVARNDEREELFEFHETPALNSWSVIYTNPKIKVRSFLDLENMSVAVLKDSVQKSYLQNTLSGFGVKARLVPVETFEEGFKEVELGNIDAVAVNHHYGSFAASRFHLSETSIVFLPSSLFFVSRKGTQTDMMTVFDYYFNQWHNDPESPLFTALKKWAGQAVISVVPRYIWWTLGAISSAVLLILAIAAYLRGEVRRQTVKVREGEDRLVAILNEVESSIYIKDKSLRYKYVNRAASESLGLPEDEIIGKQDSDLYEGKEAQQITQVDREVVERGSRYSGKEVIVNLNSLEPRTYFSVKKPLFDAKGAVSGICGISTDITEQQDFREKLDKLANFDPLTGLHNRDYFFKEADSRRKSPDHKGRHVALMLINLDNFKDINDTAGHRFGDLLLKEVAAELSQIRQANHVLARIVGDTFAFFIPELPDSKGNLIREMNDFIEQIRLSISRPKDLEGTSHRGTASIGVSIFKAHDVTIQEAFKQAELALYDAKQKNKGSFRIFEFEMEKLATDRLALEADLREAIDLGQLETFYQPQVDANGLLISFEALVRWNHPQRGLCGPSTFIPLAESSGQIFPIGKFVLESVCARLQAWGRRPETQKIVLAVNVSAREFFDEGFVHSIIEHLSRYKFNPACLELELTETQFIKNFSQALMKMSALKGMGIRISIDDFGTGYSSLSRLKQLPFDQIKIDASFVRDILSGPRETAIVKTIIDLGSALGVEVLAEGVETQAEKDALIALGCNRFQGYLDGAPMSLAAIEAKFPVLKTQL